MDAQDRLNTLRWIRDVSFATVDEGRRPPESGCVELFDLGASPVFRQAFSLGGAATHARGFRIADACIGCGKCARSCPQQCIGRR
ncbi:4Fe-4S binding protein [Olsenella sp. oral taxon 809]|uniref:4Fe-4S binding protein n=1 Tax=Olsenella sp. oral taxon 809 TaxID=661086 RepID=UPI000231F062|nr:4Fe-4S binding protein [Olsenella sp. oral taxon 809]EHF02121.1 hypothetical protein HMPREF1008_00940 [Olsenella sp. oral taxon 809 str. F0356]